MLNPNVNQFENYRDFIKARVEYLRSINPAFSYRKFSALAGFGSPNYLLLVMQGKRNLGAKGAIGFAKGLELSATETQVFLNKVYLEADKTFQSAWMQCAVIA